MRHFRLDPLGGIAGDMFAAACLDAQPQLCEGLFAALDRLALPEGLHAEVITDLRAGLSGSRFLVHLPQESEAKGHHHGHHHDHHHHHHHHHDHHGDAGHGHRSFAEIRDMLGGYDLEPAVRQRALSIFTRIAEAEAEVHASSLETITFHEVGGWDSVVDVIAAAWLIEALGPASWSCQPLPLGRGRVMTAHGPLPVPAPATAKLLKGFALIDDGVPGERVTPTGAAILAELEPQPLPAGPWHLTAEGAGLGTRELPGIANALRLTVFERPEQNEQAQQDETLLSLSFDVDDQSPEDLALALDALRGLPGVLDVTQAACVGKKGRVSILVSILLRPEALEVVSAHCLNETTTIGLRWHTLTRRALARSGASVEGRGVKTVLRPDGRRETKPEADDLGNLTRQEREQLRTRLNEKD